ncbi:MAG: hypothetical protein KAR35_06725 [Candidatus Heimdallarchaeota archaeon]|nr:hypothetical protein [Candidatus Heimdallarchaeota archaeon]MCK5049053.1 hypothetical protein [Candidatus Heimdallarchaeota archaeon]
MVKTNTSEFIKKYERIHPTELLPDYDLSNFSDAHRYIDALTRHLWSETADHIKDVLISLIKELNNRHTAVTDLQKNELEFSILKERVQHLKLELEARELRKDIPIVEASVNEEQLTQLKQKFKDELKEEKQQVEGFKAKIDELQNLIAEQDIKLITQRQNYAGQSDQITTLNKTIIRLKSDLESAIGERIKPAVQVEKSEESEDAYLIQELYEEIAKLKISRNEKKSKIEALQDKLEYEREKVSEKVQQDPLLVEKLEKAEDQYLKREIELIEEVDQLKETLSNENSSYSEFKEKHYESMGMFESQIRLLRTTFEERFIDLQKHYSASTKASIEQKEIEIRNLKQEVGVLRRKQISDPKPFETLVHSQGENITNLEFVNEELNEEIKTLRAELDATEDRFLEAQEEVGQFFHDRITDMDKIISEKEDLVEDLISQNKERNDEIEALENEIIELLGVVAERKVDQLIEEE